MTPIFDTKDLPSRRLSVSAQFAAEQHESSGDLIAMIKSDLARKLALKIMEDSQFFELRMEHDFGTVRAHGIGVGATPGGEHHG